MFGTENIPHIGLKHKEPCQHPISCHYRSAGETPAYWEVGVHWANPANIKPRATIGPPIKNAVLSKLMNNVGQMIDGLIDVFDVWLFAISELN